MRPSAVTRKLGESLAVLIGWEVGDHTTDASMARILSYGNFAFENACDNNVIAPNGCARSCNIRLSVRRRISGTLRRGVASPRYDRRCSLLVIRNCAIGMTDHSKSAARKVCVFLLFGGFHDDAGTLHRDGLLDRAPRHRVGRSCLPRSGFIPLVKLAHLCVNALADCRYPGIAVFHALNHVGILCKGKAPSFEGPGLVHLKRSGSSTRAVPLLIKPRCFLADVGDRLFGYGQPCRSK